MVQHRNSEICVVVIRWAKRTCLGCMTKKPDEERYSLGLQRISYRFGTTTSTSRQGKPSSTDISNLVHGLVRVLSTQLPGDFDPTSMQGGASCIGSLSIMSGRLFAGNPSVPCCSSRYAQYSAIDPVGRDISVLIIYSQFMYPKAAQRVHPWWLGHDRRCEHEMQGFTSCTKPF